MGLFIDAREVGRWASRVWGGELAGRSRERQLGPLQDPALWGDRKSCRWELAAQDPSSLSGGGLAPSELTLLLEAEETILYQNLFPKQSNWVSGTS